MLTAVTTTATAAALAAALSGPVTAPVPDDRRPGGGWERVTASFAPPGSGAVAVSYAPELVPPGSGATVGHRSAGHGTEVVLRVSGLRPHRTYGAHVHTGPCGPDPADAGPHYQHVPAPERPSTDPVYVNPYNEVWLDLTTDHRGDGLAASAHRWEFRPGGARSVVLHEHATVTGPGRAGAAGERLACVTVPFGPG